MTVTFGLLHFARRIHAFDKWQESADVSSKRTTKGPRQGARRYCRRVFQRPATYSVHATSIWQVSTVQHAKSTESKIDTVETWNFFTQCLRLLLSSEFFSDTKDCRVRLMAICNATRSRADDRSVVFEAIVEAMSCTGTVNQTLPTWPSLRGSRERNAALTAINMSPCEHLWCGLWCIAYYFGYWHPRRDTRPKYDFPNGLAHEMWRFMQWCLRGINQLLHYCTHF